MPGKGPCRGRVRESQSGQSMTQEPNVTQSCQQFSSVEQVRRALSRISKLDPQINAFCYVDETVMEQAEASDRRRAAGSPLSAIDGIPVAVKDNLLVAGMPATWGTALYRNFIPEEDELPIARLRAAGAIIIGKTNTPAFAARGYTNNALFGSTANPLAPELTPGGSSGGSAAALAAGMVDLALGTDGGGSTRRPAAHCGLVGLKPSIGLIPRGKGFAALMADLEVVGPMARTVANLRMLTEVLAGPHPADPASFLPKLEPLPSGTLRIAYLPAFPGHPVESGIAKTIEEASKKLARLGHEVTLIESFFDYDAIAPLQNLITNAGFAMLARREPRFAELAEAEFQEQAQAGEALTGSELMDAFDRVREFRAHCGRFFTEYDMLLTPAIAAPAWDRRLQAPATINAIPVGPRGHAVFTGWVNLAGLPAISVPCGISDGLPVGMQIVSGFGRDGWLLDLAEIFERQFPVSLDRR
jgi:Asp-tRNAAsn/Glu-tRNAGln amidotransferase A subunit and related amidases